MTTTPNFLVLFFSVHKFCHLSYDFAFYCNFIIFCLTSVRALAFELLRFCHRISCLQKYLIERMKYYVFFITQICQFLASDSKLYRELKTT